VDAAVWRRSHRLAAFLGTVPPLAGWRTLGGFPRAGNGRRFRDCVRRQDYGELRLKFQDYEAGTRFNYLALGDSLAMVSLLLMSLNRRRLEALLAIYCFGKLLLFFAYSRTSCYLFVVTATVLLYRSIHWRSGCWGLGKFVSCGDPAGVSRPHPASGTAFERMSVLVFDHER